MSRVELYPLIALLLLGAAHGVNPGMGWLFAVARGCQEGAQRAVWGALGPLAAGHALAIAVAIVVATMLEAALPLALLRLLVGAGLVTRGIASVVRHRHPRGGGMRVSARRLAWWSFLMATGHGAGLMALPLVLREPAHGVVEGLGSAHVAHIGARMSFAPELHGVLLAATAAHAVGYLAVTGMLSIVVYERIGVRVLRSAWINLDLLWAGALVVTGMTILVV